MFYKSQCYGKVLLEGTELQDTNADMIELEYHKILKEENNTYGIALIERIHLQDKIEVEVETLENMNYSETMVSTILPILMKSKVMIGHLNDVILDMEYCY